MKRTTWSLALLVVGAASLLLLRGGPEAHAREPAEVEMVTDVVYGKGAGEDLMLDYARPKGAVGPLRCLVAIHGGGWAAGNRKDALPFIREAASRGWFAATVSYRFAPKHRFPAQVEDVKCAVRYLRAHARELAIDPERIAAAGFSAGAHLALMLATVSPKAGLEGDGGWTTEASTVQAAVSWFGPTNMLAKDFGLVTKGILGTFLGGSAEKQAEAYKKASPVTHVSTGDAPCLLFQGTTDVLVPWTQAVDMAAALTAAKVPGRIELVLGAGHGFPEDEQARLTEAAFAWLDTILR